MYAVDPTRSGRENVTKRLKKDFDIVGIRASGVARPYKLKFRNNADLSDFEKSPKEKKRQVLWRELKF